MDLPRAAVDHLLDSWPVARLATVDAEGAPHLVPIVFARVRGHLWSPVDGKAKGGGELARVRNVRRCPDACLLLDDYAEDWGRLWWLRVDGTARVVEPPEPDRDPQVRPVLAALRHKYGQYRSTPVLRDPPTLLAIRPLRVRSWCAGPDAMPRAAS